MCDARGMSIPCLTYAHIYIKRSNPFLPLQADFRIFKYPLLLHLILQIPYTTDLIQSLSRTTMPSGGLFGKCPVLTDAWDNCMGWRCHKKFEAALCDAKKMPLNRPWEGNAYSYAFLFEEIKVLSVRKLQVKALLIHLHNQRQ